MKNFSAEASRLYTRLYDRTSSVSSSLALQGRYNTHPAMLVGVIRFEGLAGIGWAGKSISRIVLTLRHGSNGRYDGREKVFQLWGSNIQADLQTDKTGEDYISGREMLGAISKPCYRDQDVVFTLPDDDPAMFERLKAYMSSGAVDTLCLYIDEPLSGSYTPNYLAVTQGSISVDYDEGLVYAGHGGEWRPCMAYYGRNGVWVPVIARYGRNGEWKS